MREPPRQLNITDLENNADCMNVIVFLDGVKQDGCRWYDQDRGELNRLKLTDGRPEVLNEEFVYETIHGEITLKWHDPSRVRPL